MFNKNYLSAMAGIDEDLIVRAERKNEVNIMSKKINIKKMWLPIAACLVVAFIAVWSTTVSDVPVDENTSSVSEEQNDFAEHSGDGNENRIEILSGVEIPDELIVSSNLNGEVFCASGLDYSDPYAEENNSAEKKSERVSALSELMNLAGIAYIKPEYGPDDIFPYADTGEAVITAFSSYFAVETDCVADITHDSTDREIVEQLTENKYISALIKYIGLDPDNLYVYRETVLMYGDSDENTEPVSRMTTFKIAAYSNKPQQLAFNLSTDYIMFKLMENYAENTMVMSPVYGYFIQKNSIHKLTEYLSYDEALKSVSRQEESFDSNNAICTIIYKPDIIKRDLMPYYEFHWNTENGEQSLCIPLMK